MRARIGDLAIARFDPTKDDIRAGKKWNEKVCLVIEAFTYGRNDTRSHRFIYWDGSIYQKDLPPHRLVRVRLNRDYDWTGNFQDITIDKVVEVKR
jgi:hypothetical protein